MASYATLKAAIAAAIKENGNNEITGNLLQQQLLAMVNSLGAGFQFAGVAVESTNPGTPDQNIFYLAGSGTYTNFGNTVVPLGSLGVFIYNGSWTYKTIEISAGIGSFVDIDKMWPLQSGYYTKETARIALNSSPILAKYGVIIMYRTGPVTLRIEQFINDLSGYTTANSAWRTIYPMQENENFNVLGGIISTGVKMQNGAYVQDATTDCAFFPVLENTTYRSTDDMVSVEYFSGPINNLVSGLLSNGFISHEDLNAKTFTTPANCCFVCVNFSRRAPQLYEHIYVVPQYNINIQEKILRDNNLFIEGVRFTKYMEPNISYSFSNGARSTSSYYDSFVYPINGRESFVVRNRYGQEANVVGASFFSGTPGTTTFLESYERGTTYDESTILYAPETAKYIVVVMPTRSNHNFDEIYLVQGFSVNPLIARYSGPCFTEYRNRNANDNSRVSVGMLGNTEANLSYNMDYRTGVHKAYDPTKAAIWLALSGAGGAFQFASANQPTNGDIWESDGYRYALWFSPYQFAVNTNKDDAKGSAAIWGKRRADQATFAGFDDCIIEGNRVKGTSGVVFINAYNNGKVIIANGGGRILLGGVADDNVTRVQVAGALKAEQFKLSDLNTAPASSTDTGTKGEIRITEDYIYICVATNTWKRSPLSSW